MYLYIDKKQIGLNQIFPKSWQTINEEVKIGFTAFYLKTKVEEKLEVNPVLMEFEDSRIVIFKGVFEYPSKPNFTSFPGESSSGSIANLHSSEANIFICFEKADKSVSDAQLEQSVNKTAVILALKYGLNSIIENFITSTTLYAATDKNKYYVTGSARVEILDFELSGVALTNKNLSSIATHLESFSKSQIKNKISLATNWFLKSLSFTDVDSFLSKWICLETLCMDNSSNIAPIKDLLATIYGISESEVSEQFGIGRIYGLRNEIVHNGHLIEFELSFIYYLNHLVEDCFIHVLGLTPEFKTKQYIDKQGYDIQEYLKKVYKEYVP